MNWSPPITLGVSNHPVFAVRHDGVVAMLSENAHVGIYLQLFSSDGQLLGANRLIISGKSCLKPRAAFDVQGNLHILYGKGEEHNPRTDQWRTARYGIMPFPQDQATFDHHADLNEQLFGRNHDGYDQNDIWINGNDVYFALIAKQQINIFKNRQKIFPSTPISGQNPLIRTDKAGNLWCVWRDVPGGGTFSYYYQGADGRVLSGGLPVSTPESNAKFGFDVTENGQAILAFGRFQLFGALWNGFGWSPMTMPQSSEYDLRGMAVFAVDANRLGVAWSSDKSDKVYYATSDNLGNIETVFNVPGATDNLNGVKTPSGILLAALMGNRDANEWFLRVTYTGGQATGSGIKSPHINTSEVKIMAEAEKTVLVEPFRLYDSRNGAGAFTTGETREFTFNQGGAKAVMVRFTVVKNPGDTSGGNMAAFPANLGGTETAAVNWWGGSTAGNSDFGIVVLHDSRFKVKCNAGQAHLIIDVIGYLV
jgi:hypothetical protein